MKTVRVIECTAKVVRDATSFGPQYSLQLDTTNYPDDEWLRVRENETMRVRVEVEVESD